MRYLDGREPLLARRIAEGRIVDGHGDLLAEDIFDLPDGFRILDCLDFDDRLRYVDCVDDIAFLAMDLEFLGHRHLSESLLADYLRATGDSAPTSLVDHYTAYRALVRAKVSVIRFGQGEDAARGHSRRHLEIADRRSQRAAVRLTLIGGLPGTGKSTVAEHLSATTGSTLLASDQVRKELAAAEEVRGQVGTYGVGLYSPAEKTHVYSELLTRARPLLVTGCRWSSTRAGSTQRNVTVPQHWPTRCPPILCKCSATARASWQTAGFDNDETAPRMQQPRSRRQCLPRLRPGPTRFRWTPTDHSKTRWPMPSVPGRSAKKWHNSR